MYTHQRYFVPPSELTTEKACTVAQRDAVPYHLTVGVILPLSRETI